MSSDSTHIVTEPTFPVKVSIEPSKSAEEQTSEEQPDRSTIYRKMVTHRPYIRISDTRLSDALWEHYTLQGRISTTPFECRPNIIPLNFTPTLTSPVNQKLLLNEVSNGSHVKEEDILHLKPLPENQKFLAPNAYKGLDGVLYQKIVTMFHGELYTPYMPFKPIVMTFEKLPERLIKMTQRPDWTCYQ